MGLLVPNILDVGDVGHLAALVAPRPLVFTRAIDTDGQGTATRERTLSAFAFCRSIYQLMGAADRLKLSSRRTLHAASATLTRCSQPSLPLATNVAGP